MEDAADTDAAILDRLLVGLKRLGLKAIASTSICMDDVSGLDGSFVGVDAMSMSIADDAVLETENQK